MLSMHQLPHCFLTQVRNYTWLALARDVVRSHGARGLYAGMSPTLLKVMPAVAVSVTIRDAALGRLD